MGARTARRRPGAPLLRRAVERGGDRRDGRRAADGGRPPGGGATTGRRGQRARRRRQHHGGRRRRASGGGGRRHCVQGHPAHARCRRCVRCLCSSAATSAGLCGAVVIGRGRRHGRLAGGCADRVAGLGPFGGHDRSARRSVQDDTLAPGARLSFGDEPTTLAESGPRSDEFLLGAAASVPVARSTARVPPPPVERVPGEGEQGRAPPTAG